MKRSDMQNILIVGAAGFIGANLRYFVSLWAAQSLGTGFPWGTLIINFTSSFLLAVFVAWAANRLDLDPRLRLFVTVGFFGTYSTFSTYANESVGLIRTGAWNTGLIYILVTNGICLAGAAIGLAIGSRIGN